jgi:hypothetical protein
MSQTHVIYERNMKDLYPNIKIVLQLFVSTPAINCTAEQGRTQGGIFGIRTPSPLKFLHTQLFNCK